MLRARGRGGRRSACRTGLLHRRGGGTPAPAHLVGAVAQRSRIARRDRRRHVARLRERLRRRRVPRG
eukprot:7331295-Prymnesium_polylepis.1